MKSLKPTDTLDRDGVAELLGLSPLRVWWMVVTNEFPAPTGGVWTAGQVYEWALDSDLASLVPLPFWPKSTNPATYGGAIMHEEVVGQRWNTTSGSIVVVWPLPNQREPRWSQLRALFPSADAIVRVGHDLRQFLPALWAPTPGGEDSDRYELLWKHLSAVIGHPLPYWARNLRDPEVMASWQPGHAPAKVAAIWDVDTTPLLRLAAAYEPEHASAKVLTALARTAASRGAAGATEFMELFDMGGDHGTVLTIAAEPMAVPDEPDPLDEMTRRAGWLDILSRTDNLARACADQVLAFDGGRDFPNSNPEVINPGSVAGAEWAARLVPVQLTAAFTAIAYNDVTATLLDPATDAPVVRRARDDSLYAMVSQRLPTLSPLAELILDGPVWVRTEDGTLWLAPKDSYYGLAWGYGGTGPGTLAVLVDRLLDDISAPAAASAQGPAGLEALFAVKHPDGTVLTREQLETARKS